MAQIVRLGDNTTHGGKVISASSKFKCRGAMVALSGDSVSCPIHGINSIAGSSHMSIFGKAVVVVGNLTDCGSVIISGGSGTNLK